MIIKVCGLTTPKNILAIEKAGADWTGYIFYPPSVRYAGNCEPCLSGCTDKVGVFVNASAEYIIRIAETWHLDIIQLHGNESIGLCTALAKKGYRLIKAMSINSEHDFIHAYPYTEVCEYLLFDTPSASYGGSGLTFDWNVLNNYRFDTPFLLSGGIGPDSFDALMNFHHPLWVGIDINSKFETAPGIKDHSLVSDFIYRIRNSPINKTHAAP